MTDGFGLYTTACATITKPGVPRATADYYAGTYNAPRAVLAAEGVLANDAASAAGAALRVVNITVDVPSASGNLTQVNLATGAFVFTPVRGFRGNVTFQYGANAWGARKHGEKWGVHHLKHWTRRYWVSPFNPRVIIGQEPRSTLFLTSHPNTPCF